MKIVTIIVQIILGLIFFVFGLNGFFNFIHGPMPTGMAGDFVGVMLRSHYIWLVAGTQVVSGVLLLVNRYVPLALVLAAALIVNILTFHAAMNPSGIGMGVFVAILWLFLAWRFRANLQPLLASRPIAAATEKATV